MNPLNLLDRPLLVILAANSPLYVPVLYAKTQQNIKMEIEIAPPNTSKSDPFINRVFPQKFDEPDQLVLGIGDPMRITAIPKRPHIYSEPLVVGNLVKKMCYWIVDSPDYDGDGIEWYNSFNGLITHPRGMTGYTMPVYDYWLKTGNDVDNIKDFLYDRINPSDELKFYNGLKSYIREHEKYKVLNDKSFAFITTNPLHAHAGQRGGGGEYSVPYAFIDRPEYDKVIMTGILVSKKLYLENDSAKHIVGNFKQAVRHAVMQIFDDPHLVAYYLYKEYEKSLQNEAVPLIRNSKPFFASWTPKQLGDCLSEWQQHNVFSPTLEIEEDYWAKSIDIRSKVETLLPSAEQHRKASELTFNTYCAN